jgi:S-formylglutathione hydrolase FrmB/lysophospholipase L1-like esterase
MKIRPFLLCLIACGLAHAASTPLSPGEKKVDTKLSPSLQPVADVPGLPRVLLIGDSISMGYTLRVRAALVGRANVHRAPTNCGPTTKGLAEIDAWLGHEHWDVIHFNFGLHDLKYLKPGVQNVPPDKYEANLRLLVARLQQTGAKLIWAATTPVPPKVKPGEYPRIPGDIPAYNLIAAGIMAENHIPIDDLYTPVVDRLTELQNPLDVHFNSRGCDLLAEHVVAAISTALPPAATTGAALQIAPVEPRVWSCDFKSTALDGLPMRFLVVLPPGDDLQHARLPVIYFLHGRGRHERTLLEDPLTRARVLASPCAVVLPRGRDGWYVNSPVTARDRYADYVDEVITLAEQHFPVSTQARERGIGGWSMGGYGAMYTAGRRPHDFGAVAAIIGILDFPRPAIPLAGQNYTVPPRFGIDPDVWRTVNPRLLLPGLKDVPLFVAYADHAPERQMNEVFLSDAAKLGMTVKTLRMSGGHTFPMVQQGLGPAFSFLEEHIGHPSAHE